MNDEIKITQVVYNSQKILHQLSKITYNGKHPQLVIVTKNQPADIVLKLSQKLEKPIFGENRIQEALSKIEKCANRDVQWHFIGHLQRNKVKHAIGKFSLIQSLDSFRLAEEIEKRAAERDIVVNCLLQIDICRDGSKFGLFPDEKNIKNFLFDLKGFSHLNIHGLMTIAPFIPAEKTRNYFKEMYRIYSNLMNDHSLPMNIKIRTLSMGMTNDFDVALQEGSTMIRLGTAIFEGYR